MQVLAIQLCHVFLSMSLTPAPCAMQPLLCSSLVPFLRKSWGEGRVLCGCPLVRSVFQHREQCMAHDRCSVSIHWFIHACNCLRIFNDCWACIWHFALAETLITMYSLFTKRSPFRGVNRRLKCCSGIQKGLLIQFRKIKEVFLKEMIPRPIHTEHKD